MTRSRSVSLWTDPSRSFRGSVAHVHPSSSLIWFEFVKLQQILLLLQESASAFLLFMLTLQVWRSGPLGCFIHLIVSRWFNALILTGFCLCHPVRWSCMCVSSSAHCTHDGLPQCFQLKRLDVLTSRSNVTLWSASWFQKVETLEEDRLVCSVWFASWFTCMWFFS